MEAELGGATARLLQDLAAHCDQALILNADSNDLKEDWLATRFLAARHLAAQGRDPKEILNEAMAFLGSRVKDPATPGLRSGRMLIYWQMAEQCLRRGEDPGPALVEALRTCDASSIFNQDYVGGVLNFKGRLELARGEDPRPTLSNVLERTQPRLQGDASWAFPVTAGEAWLIQAEWERRMSLDPSESLAKCCSMADRALRIFPAAPQANAIKGLALAMDIKRDPAKKPLLMPAARQNLKLALAGKGDTRLAARLVRELPGSS